MVSLEFVCQVIYYGIYQKIQIHTIFIINIIKFIFTNYIIKDNKNKANRQIKINSKVQYYN